MPRTLLNQLINNTERKEFFFLWLTGELSENNRSFKKTFNKNVSLIDFVIYFLNFIHKKIPRITGEPNQTKTVMLTSIEKFTENPNKENRNTKCKQILFQSPKYKKKNADVDFNRSINESFNSSSRFSTPKKAAHNESLNSSNISCLSPISPIYQNQSHSTSINRDTVKQSTSGQNTSALCLGDFIIDNSQSNKKNKASSEKKTEISRRINPTSVNPRKLSNEFHNNNSFNFQQSNEEQIELSSVAEQRNLLVEERIKILSKPEMIQKTYPDLLKKQNSMTTGSLKPELNQVTFKEQLDCLIEVYFLILSRNLVLNVTSEIYFLVSILISKENENSKVSDAEENDLDLNGLELTEEQNKSTISNEKIFESLHNRVYFAVKCLESQFDVIKFYDKVTLRLLSENERLAEFSPQFSQELINWANKLENRTQDIILPVLPTVGFNRDTDNQNQFIDNFNFRSFQKQRDLFYDILTVWQENHLNNEWDFGKLKSKIHFLFHLSTGPMNYVHFVRLFKNQLLNSCAKGLKETGMSEKSISSTIPLSIDKDKLNRLTNRLVTKQSSNGINVQPNFPGHQEFFKDFILTAANYSFNKHLCDLFIVDIVELNDTKFSYIEVNHNGVEVDSNMRRDYIECIKKLKILAKFLGFVESLPYKSNDNQLPQNVLQEQIRIRSKYVPQLDIQALLNKSLEENSFVISIPWITKYLSMLDFITLRLPYYTTFYYYLFLVYQKSHIMKKSYTWIVIKFSLSWLFEMPHFPDMEYYNFYIKQTTNDCKQLLNAQKPTGLDYSNVINQNVLYICCPYLEEIKKLLINDFTNNKVAIKYITPVTAIPSNGELGRKNFEQHLEENFFHSHSPSLKKIIEYVSERVASSVVKHICYDMVPKAKEKAFLDCKEKCFANDSKEQCLKQRKIALQKQANVHAKTYFPEFYENCNKEIKKISQKKIPQAIDSLLPMDATKQLKTTAISIANRMFMERVKHWIDGHVTQDIFVKYFDSEIQKRLNNKLFDKEKIPTLLPDGGYNCEHDENALSGFHICNNIREACSDIIDKSSNITKTFILDLLNDCHCSLTKRNDINELIAVNICLALFDLCLCLVTNYPEFFKDNTILDSIVSIWSKKSLFPKDPFQYLFSPRNVEILQQSTNKTETWTVYAQIISYLVEKNFIGKDSLALQCEEFYNKAENKDIPDNFSIYVPFHIKINETIEMLSKNSIN